MGSAGPNTSFRTFALSPQVAGDLNGRRADGIGHHSDVCWTGSEEHMPPDRTTLESWQRRLLQQVEAAKWQPDGNPLKADMLEMANRFDQLLSEAMAELDRMERAEDEVRQ